MRNGSLEAKHMCKWWRRSRCHAQFRLTRLSVRACLKMSCLPQDCFFSPFFSFHFSSRPQKNFCCCLQNYKKRPDKQGRNVQMLPTSAPRPVLNCEGSGKEKTCGGFEKRKKGSGLWFGFSQTICQSAGVWTSASKAMYFTAFHHFSNKKEKEKIKHCQVVFYTLFPIWCDECFSLALNVFNPMICVHVLCVKPHQLMEN